MVAGDGAAVVDLGPLATGRGDGVDVADDPTVAWRGLGTVLGCVLDAAAVLDPPTARGRGEPLQPTAKATVTAATTTQVLPTMAPLTFPGNEMHRPWHPP